MSNIYNDFSDYQSAYISEPKVFINMDKFAKDLYTWKKNMQQAHRNGTEYPPKPLIENYLEIGNAPQTTMAKSSLQRQ
jgi:hypothetical protein